MARGTSATCVQVRTASMANTRTRGHPATCLGIFVVTTCTGVLKRAPSVYEVAKTDTLT